MNVLLALVLLLALISVGMALAIVWVVEYLAGRRP